jgi:TolB protein
MNRYHAGAKRPVAAMLVLAITSSACGSAGSSRVTESASPSIAAAASATSTPTPVPTAPDDLEVQDGEPWIVYQWLCDQRDCVSLIQPDGAGQHELLEEPDGATSHPDWSPDGKRIAFIRTTRDDRTELWTANADGTDGRMLLACEVGCNQLSYPDWAPDGDSIYYAQDANPSGHGPPTLFTFGRVDVASATVTTVLSRDDEMSAEQPRISPDGSQVVYARFRELPTPGSAIFVADLAGGPEHRLTDWAIFGAHPDWSVDGRIVFNTYDLGVFQDTTEAANLYTVGVDGSDLRQLTRFGSGDTRATQPRWTPDGTGIVFTRVDGAGYGSRGLAYIAADGTGLRWLTPEPVDGTHPQLRPVQQG